MDVLSQILIGVAVSVVAGLVFWLPRKVRERRLKKRVFGWLVANTGDQAGYRFRSTRAIASGTSLSEEKVRALCASHQLIHLSTGKKPDMWGVLGPDDPSVYEERGLLTLD